MGRVRKADRAGFKASLSQSIEGLFLVHTD
jgi:hypothetical protein